MTSTERKFEQLRLDGHIVEYLQLWQLRDMMLHRGLTVDQLAEHVGCSASWARGVLNLTRYPEISIKTLRRWLDRFDGAITDLTEARGYMCDCSDEQRHYLIDLLTTHPAAREEFYAVS